MAGLDVPVAAPGALRHAAARTAKARTNAILVISTL